MHEFLLQYQQQLQQQSTPPNRHNRTNSLQALDRLTTKIACTKESLRREQTARDDNVNEYLKLAASADKQQLSRIKAVFEKKNQKSAHNISQLQKKLESYSKRFKDLQAQQTLKLQQQIQQQKDHRKAGEVLRDVGQGLKNVGGNIRDGVTGLSASVMSKPREFAHLLKNKFGSADNINQLSSTWYTDPDLQQLEAEANTSKTANAIHSANNLGGGGGSSGKFNSEHESECSSVTSDSNPGGLFLKCKNPGSGSGGAGDVGGKGSGSNPNQSHTQQQLQQSQQQPNIKSILAELQERKQDCEKYKERIERLENLQKDFEALQASFDSERYRAERLEEQINDMTELHQTEIENLKQAMADMEEKVQYQSDERLRDLNDILENCQTRITKMEHVSQQIVLEGIDDSNARALIVKLINVVLTVLQVILLLVATGAGIIMPFLKTRVRVLTTFFFGLLIVFVFRSWPDFRDIGSHMVKRLRDALVK
jgi:alanyl-tRNA synthetase